MKRIKKLISRSPFEVAILAIALVIAGGFGVPSFVGATGQADSVFATGRELQIAAMENATKSYGILPIAAERIVTYTMTVTATAYSSEPNQTDSTPFITASGTHVRPGVIAANFLPIGTRLKIPDVYGDQIFVVEDRMNARYHKRIDVWMDSTADARVFGVRNVKLEIYKK